MKHHTGTIEVITGSMFCGKTDELIRRLRRATIARQKVQVFKPALDDRYALEKSAALFIILDRDERIRCICWGHVHQDFQSEREGVLLLGSPSSVANSLPEKNKFTLDLAGPACRWLELHSSGKVETGCLRAA